MNMDEWTLDGEQRAIERAGTPAHEKPAQLRPPADNSAGLPGVLAGLRHVWRYMRPGQALRTMLRLNQKGGVDCPGCAWPDPDDDRSSLGEYCENGLKAIAEEATSKRVGASFFATHSIDELARMSDFELGKLGRLTEPLMLNQGSTHYHAIEWHQAFDLLGKALRDLASPDEAIFYTSGRTSNEAAFLYQLFVRLYGTNNLPDCSNLCHESSGVALIETLGIGKGSVTLSDFEQAEVIIVAGQNPGTNHPRMLTALEKCKKNGGKIIAINPLPEAGLIRFTNPQSLSSLVRGGTALADLHLPVRINGDIALLKAIMKLLLQQEKRLGGVIDHAFIEERTSGYAEFVAALEQEDLSSCVAESGVDSSLIAEAVDLLKGSSRIIACWAMGLTQHENGVRNVRELVNLLLLKGAIGKAGAGTCPVRGHSNVQGDRTMGIWETPSKAFLERLGQAVGFEPPTSHGYSVVEAIGAMLAGRAHVFVAMGGNFLSASPDTARTAQALARCHLKVFVSTKLNRSHLIGSGEVLILPCLGRTDRDMTGGREQFVSVENSMGVVHASKGVLRPPSAKLKSEPAIVAGMAKATLAGHQGGVDWDVLANDYDAIRDLVEKCVPGFEHYNQKVRQPEGFYLPNGAREGIFRTLQDRAIFTVNALPDNTLLPGQYMMTTVRSHDQFNTTVYGMDDRYRGIYQGRRIVMMNEDDMQREGLKSGDLVDLQGVYQGELRVAPSFSVVPYAIPHGCTATYFPEANTLVPLASFDPVSKTPSSKKVVITLKPVQR